MADSQLMRKAGGPDVADQLAKAVAGGETDLEQARHYLVGTDGESESDDGK